MPTTYFNVTYATGERYVLTFVDGERLKSSIEAAATSGASASFAFIPAHRDDGEVTITVGPGIAISIEKVTTL